MTRANVFLLGALLAIQVVSAAGQEKVLYNFCSIGDCLDGRSPEDNLVFDSAGNLYGTTGGGGANDIGTVFELTPGADGQWTETVLHSFNGRDGSGPYAGLIFDSSGNLYGTTATGGSSGDGGYGTVFELSPGGNGNWSEKVLYSFDGSIHGSYPTANLVFDAAGNLYGTTMFGGSREVCTYAGCGIVFELIPGANGQWTEKVLHTFDGIMGALPAGGLIFDRSGNLYGTTAATRVGDYNGTVYELDRGSTNLAWSYKVLHFFGRDIQDGRFPQGGLIFDKDGNLFTTTYYGGANGDGAVVELMPPSDSQWPDKVLHSFNNNGVDGSHPEAGVVLDKLGNLYGTTTYGGAGSGCTRQFNLCGIVFELSPGQDGKWTEIILHSFLENGIDGVGPSDSLIFDASGDLYGTTSAGGINPVGATVFEILRPPIHQ